MKFIKNHLMFIMPLMAILLGIQFFLVFDRMTSGYEEKLRNGYSILVVANKPVTTSEFKSLSSQISTSEKIERNEILQEISVGQDPEDTKAILDALPEFYTLKLVKYLDTKSLEKVKNDLEKEKKITRVETFGSDYNSNYKLFSFIKFTLKAFIFFMAVVSLFLIVKQMEVWGYIHKERMQVMEIFGAPMILKTGILFRVAIVDAIIATILIILFFLSLGTMWAPYSGVDVVMQNHSLIFNNSDILILLGSALSIVVVSVLIVVFGINGGDE